MAVYLTPFQIKKYNETGYLKLTKNALKKPNIDLSLSKKDIDRLEKGETIEIQRKEGGFIPLVPLIAGIGTAVSAVTSIVNSINNKKANNQLVEQRKRQNDILEKQNKEGKPIQVQTLGVQAKNLVGAAITPNKVLNGCAITPKKVINGKAVITKKDVTKTQTGNGLIIHSQEGLKMAILNGHNRRS